jgi:hypothetical protein
VAAEAQEISEGYSGGGADNLAFRLDPQAATGARVRVTWFRSGEIVGSLRDSQLQREKFAVDWAACSQFLGRRFDAIVRAIQRYFPPFVRDHRPVPLMNANASAPPNASNRK